jgi:hypothetical protein
MSHIPWTEIVAFHQVRKHTQAYPPMLKDNPVVSYNAKVKLHGENMGVQISSDGKGLPQSRKMSLSLENDLNGFARFVLSEPHHAFFSQERLRGYIVYGEWCGSGIQENTALNQLKQRLFAVFCIRKINEDILITEPDAIKELLGDLPDLIYILPWHGLSITVDWSAKDEELSSNALIINQAVGEVEKTDPWVLSNFGVSGVGEGLVFYPVSPEHLGYEGFSNLSFKAKGAVHRQLKVKEPAQINPEKVASVNAFVDLVLTEARLSQGMTTAAPGFSKQNLGKFISWILADIQKETQSELGASGLTFAQVSKAIADRARSWFLSAEKL